MTKESTPEVSLHGRTYPKDAIEISGFGGSYEEACRLMVLLGVHWLTQHPEAKPEVGHYEGITGIDKNMNEDAESLERVMLSTPYNKRTLQEEGVTGAMVQYSKAHAIHAHKVGWETYIEESKRRRTDERGCEK